MDEKNIPDLNIFMMCDELNKEALSDIPNGFHIRYCRKDELDIWKEFPFDNDSDKNEYKEYMTNYFNDVYVYVIQMINLLQLVLLGNHMIVFILFIG